MKRHFQTSNLLAMEVMALKTQCILGSDQFRGAMDEESAQNSSNQEIRQRFGNIFAALPKSNTIPVPNSKDEVLCLQKWSKLN
jgi:hypothetical protein